MLKAKPDHDLRAVDDLRVGQHPAERVQAATALLNRLLHIEEVAALCVQSPNADDIVALQRKRALPSCARNVRMSAQSAASYSVTAAAMLPSSGLRRFDLGMEQLRLRDFATAHVKLRAPIQPGRRYGGSTSRRR